MVPAGDEPDPGGGRGGRGGSPEDFKKLLRDPALRDPRGFIMPSDQPDFPTATKFINALLKTGVTVHRATAQFTVAGKNYPAGSYVVKSAQAFRPHVLDMFEPQDHPDDIPYRAGLRRGRTTTRAGPSRIRWASRSTGSWTDSTAPSKS